MLTPQQILDIIETLYPQIDELNVWITSDLIRRVMARLGRGEGVFLTASDEWQLEVYQAAGGHLDAVQREIKRWTKATDAEIKRIFEDAGIKALAYDSNFYVEHGLAGIELAQSESMIRNDRARKPTTAAESSGHRTFQGGVRRDVVHAGRTGGRQQHC